MQRYYEQSSIDPFIWKEFGKNGQESKLKLLEEKDGVVTLFDMKRGYFIKLSSIESKFSNSLEMDFMHLYDGGWINGLADNVVNDGNHPCIRACNKDTLKKTCEFEFVN